MTKPIPSVKPETDRGTDAAQSQERLQDPDVDSRAENLPVPIAIEGLGIQPVQRPLVGQIERHYADGR